MNDYCIYDVATKKEIYFKENEIHFTTKQLNIKHPNLIKRLILGKIKVISDRYILSQYKDHIFTLVDYETQQEYDCITNATILIYLGLEKHIGINSKQLTKDLKEKKIIYKKGKFIEKKRGRWFFRIYNKLFYLKGFKQKTRVKSYTAAAFPKLIEERRMGKIYLKLRRNIAARLNKEIKKQLAKKQNLTLELTGCSLNFLIEYLESKFLAGMTWDNYSLHGWHVDHIIPCCKFNLLDKKEQEKCFHYTNLQPLWAKDNLSKNGK